jgi:hypothetical protein
MMPVAFGALPCIHRIVDTTAFCHLKRIVTLIAEIRLFFDEDGGRPTVWIVAFGAVPLLNR